MTPISGVPPAELPFSAWTREVRRRTGLSQAAFAALVGAERTAVWRWEHGRAMPRLALRRVLTRVGQSVGMGPWIGRGE